jgi:hypothetical protein
MVGGPAVLTLYSLNRSVLAMLCACLLVAALPRTGAAQNILPDRSRDVRAACAPDYFRLCRDVLPGGGRILACMNQNADKLSPRCFQALTAWGLAAANAFRACLPDAERFCAHVPPGMGRGLGCLMQNADKLSAACRDALAGQDFFNGAPDPRRGFR